VTKLGEGKLFTGSTSNHATRHSEWAGPQGTRNFCDCTTHAHTVWPRWRWSVCDRLLKIRLVISMHRSVAWRTMGKK